MPQLVLDLHHQATVDVDVSRGGSLERQRRVAALKAKAKLGVTKAKVLKCDKTNLATVFPWESTWRVTIQWGV